FVAKGRDSVTDIWGIIVRPTTFDSTRRYPVIERIYAGPHGSFVPKTFSPQTEMQALAELGFIVVQIDGMGTSNRSKAFQDVAWKNLADAGFPDRIRWHQAVAAPRADLREPPLAKSVARDREVYTEKILAVLEPRLVDAAARARAAEKLATLSDAR